MSQLTKELKRLQLATSGLATAYVLAEQSDGNIRKFPLDLSELAYMDNAAPGTVTASKAVVYDPAGKIYAKSATVAAAGSSVSDATAMTAMFNAVTGADGSTGVLLPIAAADEVVVVVNTNATNALKVYAITGSQINALGSTVAYSVTAGQVAIFVGRSATLWYTAAASDTITGLTASAAELNKNAGVTGGTVTASKTLVVDAQSSVDILRARTSRSLGGTGVPGAAGVIYEMVKEVTAIAENTATTVLTVTVPNGAHACRIEVDVMGRQGAGGTIGADESVSSSKYIMSLSRTAGVASVLTLGTQLGVANAKVSGGDTLTAVLTQSATGEGVGATNTHAIQVTIDSSNNSSGNHKCDLYVRLFNANATGVTIA